MGEPHVKNLTTGDTTAKALEGRRSYMYSSTIKTEET